MYEIPNFSYYSCLPYCQSGIVHKTRLFSNFFYCEICVRALRLNPSFYFRGTLFTRGLCISRYIFYSFWFGCAGMSVSSFLASFLFFVFFLCVKMIHSNFS